MCGSECGADKFRVLPCKTHISVGNCPYRDRCVYLHDPRVASKEAKTSTRRKNKDDTGSDAFFWPTMSKPTGRQDYQRKPHVVQAYSVDSGSMGSMLVHSMWEHFVDSCRGCSSLNATQERSVHSGKKRLVIFQTLAQGEGARSRSFSSDDQSLFLPVAECCGRVPPPMPSPPSSPYRLQKLRSARSPISVTLFESKQHPPIMFYQDMPCM
jgi:hypothetical protein